MSMLRGCTRLIALGGLAVLAAGCIPFFPGGASLAVKAVPNSANVNMVWTSAVDQDAGDGIYYYAIYVDNQYSAYVYAPASNCTLTGLKSSTTYNLMVTAVSLNDEWSGQLGGSLGRVQTTFTTPPGTSAGGPISCTNASSGAPDGDGDRLPNWTETNNGVFTNIASTGTNPNIADTDGDGIKDGDETLGTLAGLYLPGFGTNPLKKNILIEFDWFDGRDQLRRPQPPAHDHGGQPSQGGVRQRQRPEPQRHHRHRSHRRLRPGRRHTRRSTRRRRGRQRQHHLRRQRVRRRRVPQPQGRELRVEPQRLLPLRADRPPLQRHQQLRDRRAARRRLHRVDEPVPELGGRPYDDAVANTIMHELGHDLGLRHGGSTDTNCKPNYNSIMNYRFQFPGVDTNCTPAGNGVLNFSYGVRPNLNEASLNELVGVCGSPSSPWDWNGNGVLESGVARDLNNDQLLQTLGDYNDWANLNFGGLSDVDGMSAAVEVVKEQPAVRVLDPGGPSGQP